MRQPELSSSWRVLPAGTSAGSLEREQLEMVAFYAAWVLGMPLRGILERFGVEDIATMLAVDPTVQGCCVCVADRAGQVPPCRGAGTAADR